MWKGNGLNARSHGGRFPVPMMVIGAQGCDDDVVPWVAIMRCKWQRGKGRLSASARVAWLHWQVSRVDGVSFLYIFLYTYTHIYIHIYFFHFVSTRPAKYLSGRKAIAHAGRRSVVSTSWLSLSACAQALHRTHLRLALRMFPSRCSWSPWNRLLDSSMVVKNFSATMSGNGHGVSFPFWSLSGLFCLRTARGHWFWYCV